MVLAIFAEIMGNKDKLLKELLSRGYDNPKLSQLSESALIEILTNEEDFYRRNSGA